jgi:hypothetical protein
MQMQATPARKTKLKDFVGKNVFDVIVELPRMNWTLNDRGRAVNTKISQITFVDYQKRKPRIFEDLYEPISTNGLSIDVLREHHLVDVSSDRIIGLTSKLELGRPYQSTEHKTAHLPMLDFDRPKESLDGNDFLELVKSKIKEELGLRGVILKSSSKGNFHFIGIGRLFDREDFITFCGLSLTIRYVAANGEHINLVDSRHVGHALTPMKYLAELNHGWSKYDFNDRFTTLRITPKRENEELPTVIDVVD